MPDSAQQQLLHLVLGGELTDLENTTFKDLDQVEIVGVFPSYATAYAAWKAKAQQTVDNAHALFHRPSPPAARSWSRREACPLKKLLRNVLRSSWVQQAVGFLAAEYLRLVWLTNKFSFDPPGVYEIVEPQQPVILAFWHGQHFLTPFIKTKESHRAKVLISRHRDGEFNAIAAERLGIEAIRGSGDHGSAFHRKGGVGAFKEMVRALADGYNVASTADVPKRSRVAGLGIIMLARESGRPIVPFAMATSRFIRLNNWDRTTINLPFGRGALVGSEGIFVPPDADAETMEKLRVQLETVLNEATRRAYAQVGRPDGTDNG
jgi:lysophospholipid acyltransferase (LPLAT)-like uncharacterized protein